MNDFNEKLRTAQLLHIQQVHEALELLGFETRNKYKILDEAQRPLAFAAENSSGIGGTLLRHFLGHWRSFRVTIFDEDKKPVLNLHFPFRFLWKTLYVSEVSGRRVGHLQQRFAIFRKKFDVYDVNNRVIAKINSSFFRFWTFEFFRQGRSIGKIEKKWSGALSELFTDKDNFILKFNQELDQDQKSLMLATCIMVDIVYFENNKTDATDLFG